MDPLYHIYMEDDTLHQDILILVTQIGEFPSVEYDMEIVDNGWDYERETFQFSTPA